MEARKQMVCGPPPSIPIMFFWNYPMRLWFSMHSSMTLGEGMGAIQRTFTIWICGFSCSELCTTIRENQSWKTEKLLTFERSTKWWHAMYWENIRLIHVEFHRNHIYLYMDGLCKIWGSYFIKELWLLDFIGQPSTFKHGIKNVLTWLSIKTKR